MREIRLILQKNDLSISKCTRKKWGKYTLASMKQGEFEQVEADVVIAKGYFKYKKEMIKNKQAEIKERVILANERKDYNTLARFFGMLFLVLSAAIYFPHLSNPRSGSEQQ